MGWRLWEDLRDSEWQSCVPETTGGAETGLNYRYGSHNVLSLYEGTDGRLWAETESGLWRWKPGPPQLYLPNPSDSQQTLVPGEHAASVIVGTSTGLKQVTDDKVEGYDLPGIQPFAPSKLLRDRDGALWIGTYESGLLRVFHRTTTWFGLRNGLSGDLVTALFEDREGTIWVGTTNGLDRFREPVVSTISGHQVLSSPAWSVLAARDGSIWAGMLNGLDRWNRGQMTVYRAAPPPSRGGPPEKRTALPVKSWMPDYLTTISAHSSRINVAASG